MGGVMDTLFGSEGEQRSETGNRAYDEIENYLQPGLGYFTQGGDAIASLLGVGPPRTGTTSGSYGPAPGGAAGGGGAGGAAGGLDSWANSGGIQWMMDQGNRMINSNQAAKGLLNSGSTLKGIQQYGQGLGQTYLNQYMNHLMGFSKLGLGAAGVMSDAGRWSKSKGSSGKDGIAGDIIGAIAMSDERLKENIVYAGADEAGVPMHYFEYRKDTGLNLPEGRYYGVLAQNLQAIAPDLVVEKDGYLAVKAPYLPRKM